MTSEKDISTTVRSWCPPAQSAESVNDSILAMFQAYGDIARIDTTLSLSLGCIFVTFFDVRVAEKFVADSNGSAEFSPPSQHDFRAVRLKRSDFDSSKLLKLMRHLSQDISRMTMEGYEALIEFYDMRVAQEVLLSVSGSSPEPRFSLFCQKGFVEGDRIVNKCDDPVYDVETNVDNGANVDTSANKKTNGQFCRKVVHERIDHKDFSKYDINPERIRTGQDARTTVMVRNIPKTWTREVLKNVLAHCGLKYTFFYMPSVTHRNNHCDFASFAFVNLKTPFDVLLMNDTMKSSMWPKADNHPILSYARLQGHEQLVQHFHHSAVIHNPDERKRPAFLHKQTKDAQPTMNKTTPGVVAYSF